MQTPYTVTVRWDEERRCFSAVTEEFSTLVGAGFTRADAVLNLEATIHESLREPGEAPARDSHARAMQRLLPILPETFLDDHGIGGIAASRSGDLLLSALSILSPNDPLVLGIYGDIELSAAPFFEERIRRAVTLFPAATVVLDMTHCGYVDSVGLAVLFKLRLELNNATRKLQLVNLPAPVQRLLERTGLLPLFPDRA